MSRISSKQRATTETKVALTINLDGSGVTDIETEVPFFDHMLELFCAQGQFDLTLDAQGDMVDNHHMIEDVGIVLGQAVAEALEDKAGITRYTTEFTPMDEALTRISIDISGRPYLVYDVPLDREFIGDLETEMIEEFFYAFAANARLTLHIAALYGKNNHHIVESVFKGFGRALGGAVALNDKIVGVPSTKGVIE